VAEPIAEQWVVALVALLDDIVGVKPTRREYEEVTALKKTDLPVVQMGLLSLAQDHEVWPLITVEASQEIAFSVENTADAPTQLQRLKSDIEKQLRTDPQLGGLCQNLHLTQADLNAKTATGDTLEGRAVIESVFFHREDDPTLGR
jgi:hypothetical protein